jgi:hypothetical protein
MVSHRSHYDHSYFFKAMIYTVLTLIVFTFIGCYSSYIEIQGRIVSYDYISLDGINLRYFVTTDREVTQTGTAEIGANRNFSIRIKQEREFPYYVVIEGVDVVPEVSVMGNAYEIRDNNEKIIDMGEVYIYNYIEIVGNFSNPAMLKEIELHWECDIPDVDYFNIELVGKSTGQRKRPFAVVVGVSGIEGSSFSFSQIEKVLWKEGTYKVDDLVVVNNVVNVEGTFFLDVIAVRLIDGKAIEVARSAGEMVSIVQEFEKI